LTSSDSKTSRRRLLEKNPEVQSMRYSSEAQRIADMQQGNVTASLFSFLSDVQVLGFTPECLAYVE